MAAAVGYAVVLVAIAPPGQLERIAPLAAIPIVVAGLAYGLRGAVPMWLAMSLLLTFGIGGRLHGPGQFAASHIPLFATGLFLAIGSGMLSDALRRERLQRANLDEEVTRRRSAEEHYRLLADNITDLVQKFDASGICTYASPSAQSILGVSPVDLVGRDEAHLMSPVDVEALRSGRLVQVGADGTMTSIFRMARNDGSTIWVERVSRPLKGRDGQAGVVASTRDVTDRIRAEEASRLAAKQAEEAQQLKEIAEFRTRFLNNAAHELATPLTPIKLQMASMQRGVFGELGPEQAKALGLLGRNIDRLQTLVTDLLDAARLQGGRLRLANDSVDALDVAGDVVKSLAETAEQGKVRLALAGDKALVRGDATRLHQVVLNLVHNALKFTPAGGSVAVSVAEEDDHVRISVKDTGSGLDASQMSRLFQPFSQVHDMTSTTLGGTGLGLYISKSIVEQHRGTLTCTSPGPGQGTTFEVRLPRPPGLLGH